MKKEALAKRIKESMKKGFPKENHKNPMRGQGGVKQYLIQPHNFRRYFMFLKQGFNPTQPYLLKNHNSEYHFTDFYGCRIIVRKNTVEVINLWHRKQYKLIEVSHDGEAQSQIEDKREEMTIICVRALKKFVNINGGITDFVPLPIQRQAEIGLYGHELIDKIPGSMILHSKSFKKVYPDKTELLGEVALSNIINNDALNDFSPLIANELKLLRIAVTHKDVVNWLFEDQSRADWFNSLSKEEQDKVLGIG